MKKSFVFTVLFILSNSLHISCNSDESSSVTTDSKVEAFYENSQTNNSYRFSNEVNPLLSFLGITKINTTLLSTDKTKYTFESENGNLENLIIDSEAINFSNLSFIVDGNVIYEESNPQYRVTIGDDNAILISTSNNQSINFINFDERLPEIDVILFFYVNLNYDYTVSAESIRPCSVMNQLVVYGFSTTKAGAKSDLQYSINEFQSMGLLDCAPIGGVETSSLGIISVASQTYCCDGSGGVGGNL